jgi:hypothetical protein
VKYFIRVRLYGKTVQAEIGADRIDVFDVIDAVHSYLCKIERYKRMTPAQQAEERRRNNGK